MHPAMPAFTELRPHSITQSLSECMPFIRQVFHSILYTYILISLFIFETKQAWRLQLVNLINNILQ
jgi:hypothetical protein